MNIQLTPVALFNPQDQLLKIKGITRKLTNKESHLLEVLHRNVNNLAPRSEILEEIWEENSYFTARSMDVYICNLRKYLKPLPQIEIKTIHGKGFKLIIDIDKESYDA